MLCSRSLLVLALTVLPPAWGQWQMSQLLGLCVDGDQATCDAHIADWRTEAGEEEWELIILGLLDVLDRDLAVEDGHFTRAMRDLDTALLSRGLRVLHGMVEADPAMDLYAYLGSRTEMVELVIAAVGSDSPVAQMWRTLQGQAAQRRGQPLESSSRADSGCGAALPPIVFHPAGFDSSIWVSTSQEAILVSDQHLAGAAQSRNALGLAHWSGAAPLIERSAVWATYDWTQLPGVTSGATLECQTAQRVGFSLGATGVLGLQSRNAHGQFYKSVHALAGRLVFLGSDLKAGDSLWTTALQMPLSDGDSYRIDRTPHGMRYSLPGLVIQVPESERLRLDDRVRRRGPIALRWLNLWFEHERPPQGAAYSFSWEAPGLLEAVEILQQDSVGHAVRSPRDGVVSRVFWRAGSVAGFAASRPMAVMVSPRDSTGLGVVVSVQGPEMLRDGELSFGSPVDSLWGSEGVERDAEDSSKVLFTTWAEDTLGFYVRLRPPPDSVPTVPEIPDGPVSLGGDPDNLAPLVGRGPPVRVRSDAIARHFHFDIDMDLKERKKMRLEVSIINAGGETIHKFGPVFSDWRGHLRRTLEWRSANVASSRLYLVVQAGEQRLVREFGAVR